MVEVSERFKKQIFEQALKTPWNDGRDNRVTLEEILQYFMDTRYKDKKVKKKLK